MNIHPRSRATLLGPALFGVLSLSAGPALALDAEDFATTLSAAFATSGSEFRYQTATADGDDITLAGAGFSSPGQTDFNLGDLTFEDVAETGDGGYTVTRLGLADFSGKQQEAEISISSLELNGIRIPGLPKQGKQDRMISYERARGGPVSVEVNGQEVVSLSAFASRVKPQRYGAGYDIRASADDIVLSLGAIANAAPKNRKMISALGHDTLRGDMDLNMGWNLETGRFKVHEYTFNVADAGRLTLRFELDGYTPDLIEAIGREQARTEDNTIPAIDAPALPPATAAVYTGPMQHLLFISGSARFDDASATRKALAYAGGKQGMTGEQMAQLIQTLMPLAVWRLGMPELQNQISEAARTYLGNPQNLTVTANPASPVAVSEIIAARASDPWSLPRLLNVQVHANEPLLLCCED